MPLQTLAVGTFLTDHRVAEIVERGGITTYSIFRIVAERSTPIRLDGKEDISSIIRFVTAIIDPAIIGGVSGRIRPEPRPIASGSITRLNRNTSQSKCVTRKFQIVKVISYSFGRAGTKAAEISLEFEDKFRSSFNFLRSSVPGLEKQSK